ncbi:hypothetical protein CVT24_007327 [Panaeolus cyanescens]|uniref:F-box domain-containing protein n=1 Tax=Panaeolus cyanescens TaxID=181874 RepID=A0A409W5A3_9AGAR|nr:hypothetical protein CVT24_007327 [Panaeolus cyanescens]
MTSASLTQRQVAFSLEPIFPAEILAEIAGHLGDQFPNDKEGRKRKRDEMRTLATVSRTMCAIARTHIFEEIYIPSGIQLHHLANLFRDNPRLGAVVRSVECTFNEDTLDTEDIAEFFKLPKVMSLSAFWFRNWRRPGSGLSMFRIHALLNLYLSGSNGPPSLKTLHLVSVPGLHYEMFLLSQTLESLSLAHCSHAHHHVPNTEPNLKLKSLSISCTVIPFAFLQRCPNIEELNVTNQRIIFTEDDTHLTSQMQTDQPALPSLKRLHIRLWCYSEHTSPSYDSHYPQFPILMENSPALEDLSLLILGTQGPSLWYPNHRHLKNLTIDWSTCHPQSTTVLFEPQIEVLSGLNLPYLETISMSVSVETLIMDFDDEMLLKESIIRNARTFARLIGDRDGDLFPSLKTSSLVFDLIRSGPRVYEDVEMAYPTEDLKRELELIFNNLEVSEQITFLVEVTVRDK